MYSVYEENGAGCRLADKRWSTLFVYMINASCLKGWTFMSAIDVRANEMKFAYVEIDTLTY